MWVIFCWIYGKLERILCDCFDIVRKVGVCGPVTIGRVSSKQYINVTIVDTPEKESDMSRVMRMVVLSCDGVLEPQGGELFSSQLVTPAQGFGNGMDLSHHGFGIWAVNRWEGTQHSDCERKRSTCTSSRMPISH